MLLHELGQQETAGEFTYSIVVADNDEDQSAKQVTGAAALGSPVPIEYCVEPRQNIALARNKAVVNSSGDFLAFIDDDELPARDWLLTASRTCIKYGVEGVLAPVRPRFEHQPPSWLIKGGFCERPEHPTGYKIGWREARTGNVLLRRSIFDGMNEPFRPEFGSGGEDTEFFKRLIERGATFLWCSEAAVYEVVPPERCTRSYLLKRAWQRGQSAKRLTTVGGVCKSLVAAPVYVVILPFLLLAGHHRFMDYLIRICDHAGKLCALAGYEPLGDKYVTGG